MIYKSFPKNLNQKLKEEKLPKKIQDINPPTEVNYLIQLTSKLDSFPKKKRESPNKNNLPPPPKENNNNKVKNKKENKKPNKKLNKEEEITITTEKEEITTEKTTTITTTTTTKDNKDNLNLKDSNLETKISLPQIELFENYYNKQ